MSIQDLFASHFPQAPLLVRAPGRVNLIGEHTDYNEGFVLPAAIDKGITFAVAANGTGTSTLVSADLNDRYSFPMNAVGPSEKSWANYLLGVVAQLQGAGHDVKGFNCVFGGDIPIGAGLSSSAAIECGMAFSLNECFGLGIPKMEMVKMAQKAEHTYAGVQCGIMDQFASMFGKDNHVVRLDCRSMDYAYFPLEMQAYQIMLCNTLVSHSLADSEYNTRRQECETGVSILRMYDPSIQSLRDVSVDMLWTYQSEFDPVTFKRCAYVVKENLRVEQACEALKAGDLAAFGRYMYQSHYGLQHEYEVSCPELDFLVDQTREEDSILGSRMMGGGFGGCTINLILSETTDTISKKLSEAYAHQFGKSPEIYLAGITNGVHLLP